jgi:hypothetical protein
MLQRSNLGNHARKPVNFQGMVVHGCCLHQCALVALPAAGVGEMQGCGGVSVQNMLATTSALLGKTQGLQAGAGFQVEIV